MLLYGKSSSCIIFFDYYWRIECAKKHTQQCRFLEAEKDNHDDDDDDDSFWEDEEVEKKSIEWHINGIIFLFNIDFFMRKFKEILQNI